jgi:hypothetical protein
MFQCISFVDWLDFVLKFIIIVLEVYVSCFCITFRFQFFKSITLEDIKFFAVGLGSNLLCAYLIFMLFCNTFLPVTNPVLMQF